MFSGSAPMQPVTMTLPFSFKAAPIASRDFSFGAVEKPACIDDDDVGAAMRSRKLVTFRAKPRDDPLAIDERFRTAQRNEGDSRREIFFRRLVCELSFFHHGRNACHVGAAIAIAAAGRNSANGPPIWRNAFASRLGRRLARRDRNRYRLRANGTEASTSGSAVVIARAEPVPWRCGLARAPRLHRKARGIAKIDHPWNWVLCSASRAHQFRP